jgi:hypothetical protein
MAISKNKFTIVEALLSPLANRTKNRLIAIIATTGEYFTQNN